MRLDYSSQVVSAHVSAWRIAADLASGGVFTCGILAVASRESPTRFAVLVVAAGLLDGVDGALARRAGGPSAHGATLDVIADLAAFCLAPAALALTQPRLQAVLPAALAVLCAFVFASLFRLIRSRRAFLHPGPAYCGLPMPTVGALVTGMCLTLPTPLFFAGTMLISQLAVSRRPYPRLAWLWRFERSAFIALVAMAIGLAFFSPGHALLISGIYAAYPWIGRMRPAGA
jgi:phosphatidylserine synthase